MGRLEKELDAGNVVVVFTFPTFDVSAHIVFKGTMSERPMVNVLRQKNVVPLLFEHGDWGSETELGKKYQLEPRGGAILVFSPHRPDQPAVHKDLINVKDTLDEVVGDSIASARKVSILGK